MPAPVPRGASLRARRAGLGAAGFALGLLAQSLQVVLLREGFLPAGGSPLWPGCLLGAWLTGGWLGAVLGGRARRALLPALPVAGLALLGGLRLAGPPPPAAGPLAMTLASLTALGLCLGLPGGFLAARAFGALAAGDPSRAVLLYDRDCLGAFAAGTVLGLVPLPAGGLPLALAAAGTAGLLLTGRRAATLLFAAALVAAPAFDRASRRRQWARALPGAEWTGGREDWRGSLARLRYAGEETLYLGGRLHRRPVAEAEVALGAHLAALSTKAHPRILSLGGSPALAAALARHRPARLTVLAAEPETFETLPGEPPWPAGTERLVADPRAFATRTPQASFDLVFLAVDPVTDANLWRLLDLEALAAYRRCLAPGGHLVVELAITDGPPPPALHRLLRRLLAGFERVFPALCLHRAASLWIVAGEGPAPDPEGLAAAWRARGLSSPVFDGSFFTDLLHPSEAAQLTADLERAPPAASRDLRPLLIADQRAAAAEEAGGPSAAGAESFPLIALGALGLLPLVAGALRRARGNRSGAAFWAAAMVLAGAWAALTPLLVLHGLDAATGHLQGRLGLVLGGAMGGFWWGSRCGRGRPARPSLLFALQAATAAATAALLPFLAAGGRPWPWHAGAALLLAVPSGWSYPSLVRAASARPSLLYGADLLGGAAAAFLWSFALLPAVPLRGLCLAAAALLALAGTACALRERSLSRP